MGDAGSGMAPASPQGSAAVVSRHGASCRPFPSIYHFGWPLAGSAPPTAVRPAACWADAHPPVNTTHAITATRIPAAFFDRIVDFISPPRFQNDSQWAHMPAFELSRSLIRRCGLHLPGDAVSICNSFFSDE